MTYLRHVLDHLRKDLRLEWRSRDSINGMLFFALLVVVVFGLAFDPTSYPTTTRQISGGILWVALLFASITALNLSWARELRNQVLEAQRMAPSPASALFLGKALANMLFVLVVEAVLAPIFIVFFNLHVLGNVWLLALILPLGTWALVVNGTFFAALGLRARNRELLLPLLLLPISLPALLAMVQATTGVLTADLDSIQIGTWIKQLPATTSSSPPSASCSSRPSSTPNSRIRDKLMPMEQRTPTLRSVAWLWFGIAIAVLVVGFRQAIFLTPTDAAQGDVGRIFYYHVPIAMLSLLFPYLNFAASLAYLYLAQPRSAESAHRRCVRPRLRRGRSRLRQHHPHHRHPFGDEQPGASGGHGTPASPACCSSGCCTSAISCCAASPPPDKARPSLRSSLSSPPSMCPSSTCPSAGGAPSTPLRSSAAAPTPAWINPCFLLSSGTSPAGPSGASSSCSSASPSNAGVRLADQEAALQAIEASLEIPQ